MIHIVLLSSLAFIMAFWWKSRKYIWWALCSYRYNLQYKQRVMQNCSLMDFSLASCFSGLRNEKWNNTLSFWNTVVLKVGVEPDWWEVVSVGQMPPLVCKIYMSTSWVFAHTLWGNNLYLIFIFFSNVEGVCLSVCDLVIGHFGLPCHSYIGQFLSASLCLEKHNRNDNTEASHRLPRAKF